MTNFREFDRPIYIGKRNFIGLKDLVVSFYSQKCQFQCSYCNLPTKSHPSFLSSEKIKQQIDWIMSSYSNELATFQQWSVGNEGSILDQSRFPEESLNYLLEQITRFSSIKDFIFGDSPRIYS